MHLGHLQPEFLQQGKSARQQPEYSGFLMGMT